MLIQTSFSSLQTALNPTSFSPSAGKPAIVAAALQEHGFPVTFIRPRGLLFSELCQAHDEGYVRGVLTCQAPNGFGNKDPEVARSLPFTSGSLLSAALAARPELPAASLTSGFHHACWSYGGGYCTFNGLMVTTASLLNSGRADRVAILDCDAHYGNGTDDILRHRNDLAPRIIHRTMGESGSRGRTYLHKLRRFLADIDAFRPSIVLYQAGADPHINDPLGGDITTEEMTERDRMVFTFAKKTCTPLAWNLAGGYQRGGRTGIDPVLALHLNTFTEACRAYGLSTPKAS